MSVTTLIRQKIVLRLLIFVFVLLPAVGLLAAPQAIELPKGSEALRAKLVKKIQPGVMEWISTESKKISDNPQSAVAWIRHDIAARFPNQTLGEGDINALAFLVLMEATKGASADIKPVMEEVKAANDAKKKQRALLAAAEKTNVTAQPLILSTNKISLLALQTNLPAGSTNTATQTNKLDTTTEPMDMPTFRLQILTERRSKYMEAISNLMKKMSDTEAGLVQNLK